MERDGSLETSTATIVTQRVLGQRFCPAMDN